MRDDDDDLDRRLAQRLRAYEARIPEGPPPNSTGRRPAPWAALIGVAALTTVVGGLLALVLMNAPRTETGGPSPTPEPSATESSAVPPPVSPSASDLAPSPSSSATPAPTVAPIIGVTPVAEFAEEGFATEVVDLTFAASHFIGIGFREAVEDRGMVGPSQRDPLLWISPDGLSWESVALGPDFDSATFRSVVALPDGSAAIYGDLPIGDEFELGRAAWSSRDGRTWSVLAWRTPADVPIGPVADGPRGYLTQGYLPESGDVELWFSADGLTWETVYGFPREADGAYDAPVSIGAGPEGFVVTGMRYSGEVGDAGEPIVMASGDGREWIDARSGGWTSNGSMLDVAPLGRDWVMAAGDPEGREVSTWSSANGLDWTHAASIADPGAQAPNGSVQEALWGFAADIVGTGDALFVTPAVSWAPHAPFSGGGVWAASDGTSWRSLDLAETKVTDGVAHDGVVVIAGHAGAGPSSRWAARATFWLVTSD